MSKKKLTRLEIVQRVARKRMRQAEAARRLSPWIETIVNGNIFSGNNLGRIGHSAAAHIAQHRRQFLELRQHLQQTGNFSCDLLDRRHPVDNQQHIQQQSAEYHTGMIVARQRAPAQVFYEFLVSAFLLRGDALEYFSGMLEGIGNCPEQHRAFIKSPLRCRTSARSRGRYSCSNR